MIKTATHLFDGFSKVLTYVNCALRGVETGKHLWDVGKKLANYDSEQWEKHDYVEVASQVIFIGSNVMCIRRSLQHQKALDDYNNNRYFGKIYQVIHPNAPDTECPDLLKIDELRSSCFVWNITNTASFFALKKAQKELFSQVFLSEEALFRVGELARLSRFTPAQIISKCIDLRHTAGRLGLTKEQVVCILNEIRAFWKGYRCIVAIDDESNIQGLVFPEDLNYGFIPEELEDQSEVFKTYRCPITQSAIRFPAVVFSTNDVPQYFELKHLLLWVDKHNTNPLTNLPLSLNEIVLNVDALRAIQEEMIRLNLSLTEKLYTPDNQ